MFENPRRGRQAGNFTINVPKILDLKSSSEQIFFPKIVVGCLWPITTYRRDLLNPLKKACVSWEVNKSFVRWQNNCLCQTNKLYVSWELYVKFQREKHWLMKSFAFIETFAINILLTIVLTTSAPAWYDVYFEISLLTFNM